MRGEELGRKGIQEERNLRGTDITRTTATAGADTPHRHYSVAGVCGAPRRVARGVRGTHPHLLVAEHVVERLLHGGHRVPHLDRCPARPTAHRAPRCGCMSRARTGAVEMAGRGGGAGHGERHGSGAGLCPHGQCRGEPRALESCALQPHSPMCGCAHDNTHVCVRAHACGSLSLSLARPSV